MTTEEAQRQLDDRDRAADAARLGIADYVIGLNPIYMGRAAHDRAVIEATLGYLIGAGVIAVLPDEQWPDSLPFTIPPHLVPGWLS